MPLGAQTQITLAADPQGVIQPFNYRSVRLAPSRLRDQYQQTRDYYLAIPNDDLLKGFRERAGLPAPGQDMGGWYSGNDRGQTFSQGDFFHMFGQWLSAFSRMGRATGDEAMREKAESLMTEWAATIQPDGYFFFSRHPNAPHYIYDKMCGGLVDMAEYLGSREALSYLEIITHWAVKNLDRTRVPASYEDFVGAGPQRQSEWYTLSENLYRAYQLTNDPRYRDFAQVWHYTTFWGNLANGKDAFLQKHAYSHVNALSSAAMAFAVTGERQYFDAIANGYRLLWDHHLYATGGYGPEERFRPRGGSLGEWLDPDMYEFLGFTFEVPCGSWAGFKLSRYLMSFTGAAHYGDWIERLVYNGIGAALPMTGRGRTFYNASYMMTGAFKTYDTQPWACCSGTYPLAVADYHNLIYFKDAGGIYVNLFVPSEVKWEKDGAKVTVIQETMFPEMGSTALTVCTKTPVEFALRFRVPGWATQDVSVSLNGQAVPVSATPGQWAEFRRVWRDGDTLCATLPMRLSFVPVDELHPHRAALMMGPVVLVADHGPQLEGDQYDPASWIVPTGESLTFRVRNESPQRTFRPFFQVGQGVPYTMYLDITQ